MTGPAAAGEGPAAAQPPSRVVVAIDGSPASEAAVRLVAALPWPAGTAVRVVEAIGLGPTLIGGPWPTMAMPAVDSEDLDVALRQEARDEVEAAIRALEAEGRDVTAAVERGRPASVILDETRAMSADLVVVGSRGHGTIASMLLGSVSAEVVDHAPCPVLVARHDRVRRMILAWDGSPPAMVAADAVRTWPILAGPEVVVVTVADIGIAWWTGFTEVGGAVGAEPTDLLVESADAARAHATDLADEMVARLVAAGHHARANVREGDAATELLAAAREADADLIVLATHGRTGLARLTLGSVANNVTRHARCSVLIVRPVRMEASTPRT